MIKTPLDIIKESEYYVGLDSFEAGNSVLHIGFNEPESYAIKWDSHESLLLSAYKDFHIKCPDYCVPILTYIILKSVCTVHQYPEDLVVFKTEKKQTPGYCPNFKKDDVRVINIFEIVKDIIDNGLSPHHVQLARENDVWDGFKCIIDEIYKVDIR